MPTTIDSIPPISAGMQLFLVVLGGRSRGCHIEQHDVRFVAGERIDDTLPELRRQWFGLQRGLHLDSWQRIERVEGWRVELRHEPCEGPMRLWFVNVGAYDPACAWELHAFGLFVASGAAAAKAKARRHLLVGALQQHKDDSCAVNSLPLAGPAAAGEPVPPESTPRSHPPQGPQGPDEAPTRPQTLAAAGSQSRSTASRHLERVAATDDLLALQRLGRWQVHLLPPEPEADTGWQPLRPDWFGYRRIDRPQPG